MNPHASLPSRRVFLGGVAFTSACFLTRGVFAEELTQTPRQTEGPFYPDKLPLDTDNDLIVINDGVTPAVGDITHLTGRILDAKGNPVRNAVVEIWQCDSNGSYLHSRSGNREKYDTNFQGYGRFLTNSNGPYYFRTITPVPDPGHTPHIHDKVRKGRKELLTTQCYIKGHEMNARDGVLRGLRDAKAKESLMVPFEPIKDSKIGELSANFDVVLGLTPEG